MWAIAIHTFRGALRERVIQSALGGLALALLGALVFAQLSLDQGLRVVQDLSLAASSLGVALVAAYLGAARLGGELEDRTLHLWLARGLSRSGALLGLYLGALFSAAFTLALASSALLWVVAFEAGRSPLLWAGLPALSLAGLLLSLRGRGGRSEAGALGLWALATLALTVALSAALWPEPEALAALLGALLLILGEAAILAALGLLCASFARPFVAGVLTAGAWILGRSLGLLAELPTATSLGKILAVAAKVLPNLYLFVPGLHLLRERAGGGGLLAYLAPVLGYGLLYAALALGLAALLLRRRDLA